jgi:Tol biopolymer transport system component
VRRTLELCFEKDARKRIADMRDVRLALAGAFAPAPQAQPFWRRALPAAAMLALGLLLASAYFTGVKTPAVPAESTVPKVSRFVLTPPATAPLSDLADLDLTISPDGQRIAYWAQKPESGDIELYVRELDALEARAIPGTAHAPSGTRNAFFAPDGRSIGHRTPNGSLVSVAIDGRPPVTMADGVGAFTGGWWSSDNSVIFTSAQRLERVSAVGGGTPQALMPPRTEGAMAGPVLLPGGRAVLFHAFADGAGDRVAVLDLDTGEERTVIEGGSNPAYLDSGHVVFARGDTLMAVAFEVSELAVTGEPVALVQGVRRSAGGATDYALAANGTLVYVPGAAQELSSSAVVWVDRAGQVAGRAVAELVTNPRDPRISPDGQRLLLVTGAENDGDLWSYDLRGRPPIPLALPNDNRLPVWSPDGRQVAFFSFGGGGAMTLASDGSERAPRPLRPSPETLVPYAWSAAGELIAQRFTGDIVAIPATSTSDVRNVVTSDSLENDPALSPDGRWLAYVSNRTGQNEVWVQRYPEGVPVRVSSAGGYEPLWSLDGRELFFRDGAAMMAVAVETGDEFSFAAPRVLFSGPYVQRAVPTSRGYDVAPDGRFLMILPSEENRAAAPASIVVVQNFGEEIRQRAGSGR